MSLFYNDPKGTKQRAWDRFLKSLTRDERELYYGFLRHPSQDLIESLKAKIRKMDRAWNR